VIAYARKVLLGLDQHDDRSESPQIEADMGPPPIGKAQAIRLIKRNPKSNALKRDRQGKKFGYFIERPPIHGWQPGNVACLQVPCQRTPKKTGRWLACHPQPIACSRSALTRSRSSSQVPPRLRTHPVCVAGSALCTICYYCHYCRLLLPLPLPIAVVAMG
jgi:hypothetical protein